MTRHRHVTADPAVLGLAAAFAAVVATVVTAAPARAQVFDKEHIHESFVSDPYDCEGISAVDSVDRDILITAVLRGSSPFPAFREHFAGTVVTTNTRLGAPSPPSSRATTRTTRSPTTATAPSPSPRTRPAPLATTTSTASSYSGTLAASGSPSTWTTTAPPATRTTTPRYRTPCGSSAAPPATRPLPAPTSAPISASSPPHRGLVRRQPLSARTHMPMSARVLSPQNAAVFTVWTVAA
jgi:hypothetical protein